MSVHALPRRPPLRRVLGPYARRAHRRDAITIAVAIVLEVAFSATVPLIVASGIDRGVLGGDRAWVAVTAAAVGAIVVFQCATTWCWQRAAASLSTAYLSSLRGQLLRQLFRLDLAYFTRTPAGQVVSRLTSDVENLQAFVEAGVPALARAALLLVFTATLMVWSSPVLAGATAVCLLPLLWSTFRYRRRSFGAHLEVRDRVAALLAHLNESLLGMRVVQAFGLEHRRRLEFESANDAQSRAKLFAGSLHARYMPVSEAMPPLTLGVVVVVGFLLVSRGNLTIGAVIGFTLYLNRLFEPIQQLAELSHLLQTAVAGQAKLFSFLDERPEVTDGLGAPDLPSGPGEIVVEDVCFRYRADSPDVLHHIDLRVPAGQAVALVGRSGCGKSTLAKLLVRFHDPTEGRVAIDGWDLRSVTGSSVRARVALLPQEGYLFDGSVVDNITAARPGAGSAEAEAACRALGILERLSSLPCGLRTPVVNGGLTLSSGQRQLVALARAWLADPQVLVLDESTSNLDPATRLVVERALGRLMKGRTSVVIAHRLATALAADRVVVLADGRIVDDGVPADLLQRDGAFARWAKVGDGATRLRPE